MSIGKILFEAIVVSALPLLTIWSLNTLFPLQIPYTIWTWLSVFWLVVLVMVITPKSNVNQIEINKEDS